MFKKLFLAFLGLIVILAVVIFFFGSTWLNNGIKKGVETMGPKVTLTSVTLESANLSVLSGSGTLTGLKIGNPEGYKSENIFALGEIQLAIEIGSLLSDKIIIEKLIIKQPEISYETSITDSNVKQLLANIEQFTGPAAPKSETAEEAPAADAGPGKQVVIKQVLIEDGTVYVGLMGAGTALKLPRIELTDVGENNKVTMAQASQIILDAVMEAIQPAIQGQGKQILDDVMKGDTSSIKGATDSIKGLFGK